MAFYLLKLAISAATIVAVSELSKRFSTFGALLASLPVVSVLAMIWLYMETGDVEKVARLSTGIFWLVIPSLALFLILPAMLHAGWNFWGSLTMACVATALVYLAEVWVLHRMGIQI